MNIYKTTSEAYTTHASPQVEFSIDSFFLSVTALSAAWAYLPLSTALFALSYLAFFLLAYQIMYPTGGLPQTTARLWKSLQGAFHERRYKGVCKGLQGAFHERRYRFPWNAGPSFLYFSREAGKRNTKKPKFNFSAGRVAIQNLSSRIGRLFAAFPRTEPGKAENNSLVR